MRYSLMFRLIVEFTRQEKFSAEKTRRLPGLTGNSRHVTQLERLIVDCRASFLEERGVSSWVLISEFC